MSEQDKKASRNAGDHAGKKTGFGLVKSFLLVTAASLILMVLLLFVINLFWKSRPEESADAAASPAAVLQKLRESEDRDLSSYAVIDTLKGTYRIPIEKAMELTVEEARKVRPDK